MQFNIPPHINALIFDLDGTLADSMPVHFLAWQKACEVYDITLSHERFLAFAGLTTRRIIEILAEEQKITVDIDEIVNFKEQIFLDNHNLVQPVPHVFDFYKSVRGIYPMGIATGGIRKICNMILTGLKIHQDFQSVMTADDVLKGKPDPEIFLKVANELKVHPKHCLVFEDGEPGITGARNCGMSVVDVRDGKFKLVHND